MSLPASFVFQIFGIVSGRLELMRTMKHAGCGLHQLSQLFIPVTGSLVNQTTMATWSTAWLWEDTWVWDTMTLLARPPNNFCVSFSVKIALLSSRLWMKFKIQASVDIFNAYSMQLIQLKWFYLSNYCIFRQIKTIYYIYICNPTNSLRCFESSESFPFLIDISGRKS